MRSPPPGGDFVCDGGAIRACLGRWGTLVGGFATHNGLIHCGLASESARLQAESRGETRRLRQPVRCKTYHISR